MVRATEQLEWLYNMCKAGGHRPILYVDAVRDFAYTLPRDLKKEQSLNSLQTFNAGDVYLTPLSISIPTLVTGRDRHGQPVHPTVMVSEL